jgi:hypothetical protein
MLYHALSGTHLVSLDGNKKTPMEAYASIGVAVGTNSGDHGLQDVSAF